MRIKSGYKLSQADGHYTITAVSGDIKETIYLDEISLFLWNVLGEKELTKNEMLNLLLDRFEISTVLALSEIDKFVKILSRNGIIE